MEAALTLIYVLIQLLSPETTSFSMQVTPDSAFYGTKQENGVWRIETGKEDSKVFFGDAHIEGRKLIIKTGGGEIPFEAANIVNLPDIVDWKNLKDFGKEPMTYEIRRGDNQFEFVFTVEGAEHSQSVVAKFKP